MWYFTNTNQQNVTSIPYLVKIFFLKGQIILSHNFDLAASINIVSHCFIDRRIIAYVTTEICRALATIWSIHQYTNHNWLCNISTVTHKVKIMMTKITTNISETCNFPDSKQKFSSYSRKINVSIYDPHIDFMLIKTTKRRN